MSSLSHNEISQTQYGIPIEVDSAERVTSARGLLEHQQSKRSIQVASQGLRFDQVVQPTFCKTDIATPQPQCQQFLQLKSNNAAAGPKLKIQTTSNTEWSLEYDLPTPPVFAPIEPTHRVIEGAKAGTSPQLVADRIADALEILNVQALYVSSPRKTKVKCTSPFGDDFRVFLYTIDDDKMLVELQRREGSSLMYHGLVQQILGAADGEVVDSNVNNDVMLMDVNSLVQRMQMQGSSDNAQCSSSSFLMQPSQVALDTRTLDLACAMMSNDRTKSIGLQLLQFLATNTYGGELDTNTVRCLSSELENRFDIESLLKDMNISSGKGRDNNVVVASSSSSDDEQQ
uniref:Uncharacterized protein n=1 Tax=Leptocylindrus danicus TaxID=163516 RepID=A0A7S2PPP7_9STRA